MKLRNLFFSLTLLSITSNSHAQTIDTSYVDGAIYLKIHDTSTTQLDLQAIAYPELATLFTAYQANSVSDPFKNLSVGLEHTYRVEFSSITSVDNFVAALNAVPYVDYAEKVPLFYTNYIPNDIHANQWHLTTINAQLGWDFTTGNSNIKIAIVDNAVSTIHGDLVSNMYTNPQEIPSNGIDDDLNGYVDDVMGFDVAHNDSDPNPPGSSTSSDPWVHGTHCAGIASASTDNGTGIASIGFNCSIIPVKCTPDSGDGMTLPYAYEGVSYSINAGADIISMSFGSSGTTSSITGQQVITAANLQGVVLVGAAGNDDSDQPHYPGSFLEVINVGSTSISDTKSFFSNYGPTIDVMAPGSGIYSTLSGGNDEYGNLSGTSMACPMVAGLCGLVLAQDPTRTVDEVKTLIESGCDNIDVQNPSYAGQLGAGRINAYNTLKTVLVNEAEINEFVVYPNPSSDYFEIKLEQADGVVVKIYDNMGSEVYSGNYSEEQVYGENLTSGVYTVVVRGENINEVKRLVKLK